MIKVQKFMSHRERFIYKCSVFILLSSLIILSFGFKAAFASPLRIPIKQLPTNYSVFNRVIVGPGGNLWFGDNQNNQIDVMNTSFQVIKTYSVSGGAYSMAVGSDGNIWFTNPVNNTIGKITPTGSVSTYSIPTSDSYPMDITLGPDGNLWFSEYLGNKIGTITTSGVITEYSIPTSGSKPIAITSGPDGNLWFTESGASKIGKITPSGTITEYTTPTSNSVPWGITSGPNNNLWFTENNVGQIAKITTSGVITEYSASVSFPAQIIYGPDGNLWFSNLSDQIYSLNPNTDAVSAYSGSEGSISNLLIGPDNNIWYASSYNNYPISGTNSSYVKNYGINNSSAFHQRFTTITNSSGSKISLFTRASTQILCSSSVSQSSLPTKDPNYNYPDGLVNLCFSKNSNNLNYVTLFFQTNLTPSQVVARDYNSLTKTFMNIPGAVINESSFDGSPALELTYNIPSNSPLNSSSNPNIIDDPVGLAVSVNNTSSTTSTSTTGSNSKLTPDTGAGEPLNKLNLVSPILILSSFSIIVSLSYISYKKLTIQRSKNN